MENKHLYWHVEALNDIDLGNSEIFEKGHYLNVPASIHSSVLAPKVIVDTLRAEGFFVQDESAAMNKNNWEIKFVDEEKERAELERSAMLAMAYNEEAKKGKTIDQAVSVVRVIHKIMEYIWYLLLAVIVIAILFAIFDN